MATIDHLNRDELGILMLCAWCNVPRDKAPPEWDEFPNAWTREAWARVALAAIGFGRREKPRGTSEVDTDLEKARCPHCQAANVFVRQPYHDARHHVECRSCDMRGPVKMSTEEAIEAWNQLPRNSVKLIEQRIQEIVDEHGDYEPDTNFTNLPEWAETVIEELENLIKAVQAGGS